MTNDTRSYFKEVVDLSGQVAMASADVVNLLSNSKYLHVVDRRPELTRRVAQIYFKALKGARARSTGENSQVYSGLFAWVRGRGEEGRPRLADLAISLFIEAQPERPLRLNGRAPYVPSPLQICVEALTDPLEPQSRAWVFAAVKSLVGGALKVWPQPSFGVKKPSDWVDFTDQTLDEYLGTLRRYTNKRDTKKVNLDPAHKYLLHILAAKGYLVLKRPEKKEWRFGLDQDGSDDLEFALARRFSRLPDTSVLSNEIIGVPIAIRGAEVVLSGGLKASAAKGLVIQVSGGAGAGKTSVALSICAALAPLDTQSIYLTLEEGTNDLKNKLLAHVPASLRQFAFHFKDDLGWFQGVDLPPDDLGSMSANLGSIRDTIGEIQDQLSARASASVPVSPVPVVVVIDSVSALVRNTQTAGRHKAARRIARMVGRARALGALVVLITGRQYRWLSDALDYLVDISIGVRVDDRAQINSQPMRRLIMRKARHQFVSNGTHGLHLSGDRGVRLSPQLPSYVDAMRDRAPRLFDSNVRITCLRDAASGKDAANWLMYARSKILIHGRGSSGKAALALAIALAPRAARRGAFDVMDSFESFGPILVISFLYPENYYGALEARIAGAAMQPLGPKGRIRGPLSARVETLYFSPGYIAVEDVYSRIEGRIEAALLRGMPYHTVILDGLHNVALQFPQMRDSDALWPIVFGLLTRSRVTTITTFTDLELDGSAVVEEDRGFRLKGHLPLLHSLVQASDYMIDVVKDEASTKVTMTSSVSNYAPRSELYWDRHDLTFSKARRRTVSQNSTRVSTDRAHRPM